MTYQAFLQELIPALKEVFPDEVEIEEKEIRKNNGIVRSALLIHRPGVNIAPTVYPEDFYVHFLNNAPLAAVAQEIYDWYSSFEIRTGFDMEHFLDFSGMRSSIIFRLINMKRNYALLQDTPYIPFLDLAITFECRMSSEEYGDGAILIRQDLMRLWGVTKEDLYDAAKENSLKEGNHEFCQLFYKLSEMTGLELPLSLACGENRLYFLSTGQPFHGAAVLLYPEVLAKVADTLKEDYYIIPSSIHEVLCVPVSEVSSGDWLTETLQEVNRTQVAEAEVLSDHIMLYSRTAGSLQLL